jgi:RimJ/RimL family protein N-acetyltransferase
MKPIFLKGKRIDLRVLDPKDDLESYSCWINDQELTVFLSVGKFPTTRSGLRDFINVYKASKDLLLGIFKQDEHIGNITLHHIDWQNRVGELGILIGDKKHHGKGYGSEAVRLLLEHAFNRLNLRKVTAGMFSGNKASQKMFEKLGFMLEGCLREQFFYHGKYYHNLRYGLLRREWVQKTEQQK